MTQPTHPSPASASQPPGTNAEIGAAPAGGQQTMRSKLVPILVVTAGLVVAAVALTGFWRPGYFLKPELNIQDAETRIHDVLADPLAGYGAPEVGDVTCNNGVNPRIKVGGTFSCDVAIGGKKHTVTSTFADREGSYWIGPPA